MAYPESTAVVFTALGYQVEADYIVRKKVGVISVQWFHADPQPTEQQVNDYANDITTLPSGQTLTQWIAENGGDPILTRRRQGKERVDDAERIELRALIELFNKRDNYLVNRITELQQAMDAMKASSGAAQNIRDAIPASWLPTATRPRPAAVQDYKDGIDAGDADA